MKSLTARQIIRILESNDFQATRKRGSHIIYKHLKTGQIVPIPLHNGNRVLPIGTFLAIVKQSGLAPERFQK